jgi:hypothetical protein
VSPQRSPRLGEFETEVVLPCRVEYHIDPDGDLYLTAVIPLTGAVPEGTRISFAALPAREQRCLKTEAQAAAEEAHVALKTARAVERHEASQALD